METIVKIDEKEVPFRSNGVALLIYKAQFGCNLIPDILSLVNQCGADGDGEIDVSKLDAEKLYNMCWLFAKIADDSIPPVLEWAGSFDSFPIVDVFRQIIPLVMSCITCSAEVKNAAAAVGMKKKMMPSKQKASFFRRTK